MEKLRRLLPLALLILLAAPAASLHAQEPIRAEPTSELLDEMPRRLRFAVEASSSAGDIVEARLIIRPIGASASVSEPIEVEPAPSVSLDFTWQMQQNFIPPGVLVEAVWRLTDSAGNELETPTERLRPLDPRFDWQGIEDEELAVHWYDGDERWGQAMFERGKEALAVLEEELGTDVTRQVSLVVYRNQGDFQGAFPPQQEWIGGQAFPNLGTTVQIIQAGDSDWMTTVIFHELSHLVFDQAMEGALASPPNWLEEGLAMYNEPNGRGSADRVDEAAREGELLPFSALQGNFGADGRQVGLAYAQSELMVSMLIDRCGRDGFRNIVQNLVDDLSLDDSMRAACGFDSETLYNEWRAQYPGAPDGAEATEAPPATPLEQAPAGGVPGWLIGLVVGGLCLMGLLAVAMVLVLLQLRRSARPATDWRE